MNHTQKTATRVSERETAFSGNMGLFRRVFVSIRGSHFMRLLHLALVTFVAASALPVAAGVPRDFVDIRWGAPISEIKRVFAQRPRVELVEETQNRIVYKGGHFTEYAVDRWELEIGPNGFASGTVYLSKQSDPSQQFNKLLPSLTKKYGKASPHPADGNGAGATWKLTDPATGRKNVYTIFLRYSWSPYAFSIRYAYDPNAPQTSEKPPVPKGGKKDL